MNDPVLARLDHLETPVLHSTKLAPVAWALALIGAAAFAGVLAAGDPSRAWSALLVGMLVPVFLAAGALFFLAVNSLGGARWIVPFTRVMEGAGAGLPLALIAFAAIGTVGLPYLYDWAGDAGVRATLFADPHGSKALWMQGPRFLATGLVILGLWMLIGRLLAARSGSAEAALRGGHVRVSVAALLVLVPSFTLLIWDAVSTLDVHFSSQIFGAYCLIGAIHAFLGAVALVAAWLGAKPLAQVLRPHLRKDLGTWMVAWSCIVAYVVFVQYMIMSFANIDEEGHWLLMRHQHGYGAQAALVAGLRCVAPFLILLGQQRRDRPWALGLAGAAILLGTWLDLHWLVIPAFSPNHYRHPLGPEFLVALGFLAGTFLLALRMWRRRGLVAVGDARLLPAINAEHLS